MAQLSAREISEMGTPDLIRVLGASQVPLLQGRASERLQFLDRDVLERLVYLARRCCRNQGY